MKTVSCFISGSLVCIKAMLVIILCLPSFAIVAVVIGWERDMYQFNENAGQSRLCAVVFSGSLAITLPALGINTRDGTASRGTTSIQQDYIPTPAPNESVFSSTNMGPMCTNIPIVNDNLLEQTIENFFADLAFAAGSEPDRVTVAPAITEVDIIDDDRKYCSEDMYM